MVARHITDPPPGAPKNPLYVSPLAASEETLRFQEDQIVFDGLTMAAVLDEPYTERWLEAGVNAVNITVHSEDGEWDDFLTGAEGCLARIDANPLAIGARDSRDILRAKSEGKLAVILGTQGSMALGRHVERAEIMHRLGVRFFGPSYSGATLFCSGCGERHDGGLTYLGRELIDCLNGLDMIVDVSHCGHLSRREIAEAAKHPVSTHSNAYAIYANDRNTQDETARLIAEKGGVMGVCCLTKSVAANDQSLAQIIDHLEHYIGLVGADHAGFGFDLVEAFRERYWQERVDMGQWRWRVLRPELQGSMEDVIYFTQPRGIESIRNFPNATQMLFDRGHTQEDVAKLIGGNWFRKFKEANG